MCVLSGAVVFFSDLVRGLDTGAKLFFDFVKLRSYSGKESSGRVELALDVSVDLAGRDVIVVEDIIDTGRSLFFLADYLLKEKKAASVRLCCLLDKPSRRVSDVRADFVGFEIPDLFVVGYGLDYDQHYRNLPYVAVVR